MRTAIVTGANRGLGRGIAQQLVRLGYRVILTCRDEPKGQETCAAILHELQAQPNGNLIFHPLDVTVEADIQKLRDFVVAEYGAPDVLINNAAILLDPMGRVLHTPLELYRETMETNLYGALRLCQVFIPLMLERGYGRVVNVSSGAGQMSDMVDDMTAYRLSKLALNGLTRILANSLRGTNVLVNAACPGWLRTDMGSPNAPRSVEEGAEGIVWLAMLPDGGPQGGFFRDQRELPW